MEPGDPILQEARQVGSEVLIYQNIMETRNVRVSQLWEDLYMGDSSKVPRWLGPDGKPRTNFRDANGVPLTQLLDLTPGSPWPEYALNYLGARMVEGLWDGLFLDAIGTKPWDAGFDSWPVAEQARWRAGALDFMRRLDALRRKLNPDFIIVNNNHWNKVEEAERYVDGVCLEGHDPALPASAFVAAYPSRTFGNLGHRRVLTISKSKESALRWAAIPGVTHVCAADQDGDGKSDYGKASAPVVSVTTDLFRAEAGARIVTLKSQRSDLLFELAQAQGERQAAIEQRDAAFVSRDTTLGLLDYAQAELSAANSALVSANAREAAASTAAYNLQQKINSIRSILS